MTRTLLRFWVLATALWWGYNIYILKLQLSALPSRDWTLALKYGVNSLACDLKIAALCTDLRITFFDRFAVAETWNMIVVFVVWPLLFFFLALGIAWAMKPLTRKPEST